MNFSWFSFHWAGSTKKYIRHQESNNNGGQTVNCFPSEQIRQDSTFIILKCSQGSQHRKPNAGKVKMDRWLCENTWTKPSYKRNFRFRTPFFRNELVESNCLMTCFRSPRFGSRRSFLPASFFEIFTSIEPTCSKGSPDR